ncbi:MAG: hypothetical protein FJ138_04340 [Deltaproteobacteria bacterium]|nr:hypothetical protein [Deltaproteobacteria bacterium]
MSAPPLPRAATTAVVFVGGDGARLGGAPKWLIALNGEPLLARALRVAVALSDDVALLARAEGRGLWDDPRVAARTARALAEAREGVYGETLGAALRARPPEVWREGPEDARWGGERPGALTALCAALARAPRPWLWALACELPHLSAEALLPLSAGAAPPLLGSLYAEGAGAGAGAGAQPLAGLWAREALAEARAQLAGGSLRRLCAHERVRLTPAPAGALLHNLNAPRDLTAPPPPGAPGAAAGGASRLHFTLPLLS